MDQDYINYNTVVVCPLSRFTGDFHALAVLSKYHTPLRHIHPKYIETELYVLVEASG